MTNMYVRAEADGTFTLRQERFRERKTEHPHDVCAVARSRDELRLMCEPHWPDVNYGTSTEAALLAGRSQKP